VDPNANLEEQRRIAMHIIEAHDAGQRPQQADVGRLAELVLALDGWCRSGGALPKPWCMKMVDSGELLNLSTPGIHAAANVDSIGEPLRALCGGDGSYGSPELVTCPQCRVKLLDGRIERLSNVVAELLAETTRIGEIVDQPDWRERR
jgi:hypothetical protein